jgi:bidirectional [NiFe] hydrogenase diaphorase subunit
MPALYVKPTAPTDDKRWKIVETRMRRMGDRPEALIEALHAAQEAFGFLDADALHYVGDTLGVPHSRVYGVATFYSFFTLKPQGEHTCVVCTGTACYINGAKDILEASGSSPSRPPRTARCRCSRRAVSVPAAWRPR